MLLRDDGGMDNLVILVASYAVFLVPLGALVVWLQADRRDKVTMVVAGLVALVLLALSIKLAAHAWTDPRPFVVDGRKPLIAHVADNGFPSDHVALGATIAGVVLAWRRWWGIGLLAVVVAVGAARVAAHIHHVPDILGGLLIGLVCAALGVLVARFAVGQVETRRLRTRATTHR